MFQMDPHEIHIVDNQGDLFMITGRIAGQDDDTALLIQAGDEDRAQLVFLELINPLEVKNVEIFINDSRKVGAFIKPAE